MAGTVRIWFDLLSLVCDYGSIGSPLCPPPLGGPGQREQPEKVWLSLPHWSIRAAGKVFCLLLPECWPRFSWAIPRALFWKNWFSHVCGKMCREGLAHIAFLNKFFKRILVIFRVRGTAGGGWGTFPSAGLPLACPLPGTWRDHRPAHPLSHTNQGSLSFWIFNSLILSFLGGV